MNNPNSKTSPQRTHASNERFAHIVRMLSRSFRRSLEFRLSEHTISFGQWIFLRILWDEDGLSQRELSLRAGVMEPTAHTALQKMEVMGLIERRAPNPEKRRLLVFLSKRGHDLRKNLVPLAEEANRIAMQGLDEADIERTRKVLLAMVENLSADEARLIEGGLSISPKRNQS